MAKKREDKRNDPETKSENPLSRRDFLKTGAAAGLGAAVLSESDEARAHVSGAPAQDVDWDYEADVVIAGGGCAGLTAAIRARDLGASVLVVDQNFDLGGRMLHSGSFMSLGGGDWTKSAKWRRSGMAYSPRHRRRGARRCTRARVAGVTAAD